MKQFKVRLDDETREMVNRLAERNHQGNVSAAVRTCVRETYQTEGRRRELLERLSEVAVR